MISCLENITFGWYSWLICPSFAVLILIIWSRYCLVYPPCIFSFPLAILIITVEVFLFSYSNFPSTFISQKSSPSFIHSFIHLPAQPIHYQNQFKNSYFLNIKLLFFNTVFIWVLTLYQIWPVGVPVHQLLCPFNMPQ